MKLDDRLTTHFTETSAKLTGPAGQVETVTNAAENGHRLSQMALRGGLLVMIGVAAVGLIVGLTGRPEETDSIAVADQPTRVVVSPYLIMSDRLLDTSDETIFTVTAQSPFYWRVASLELYEDEIWKTVRGFEAESLSADAAVTGTGERTILRQEFEIVDLDAIWLPAAPEPVEVSTADDVPIGVDSYGNAAVAVTSDRNNSTGLRYTVVSSIAVPNPDQLRAAPPADPDVVGREYFSTESTPVEIRALARQLTDGLTNDYDKLIAIQNHLRTYNYSADSTGDLLETENGSAQQFASVYALMARELGLPSRVAIGFTPGEPVDRGEADSASAPITFEVKNSDAHAWPEIYFEGTGWVAFEPTPGRSIPLAERYTGVAANED